MTGKTIALTDAAGNRLSGYLATPPSGRGIGVAMFHDIFGMTDWIRKEADLFAAAGFVVLVPDMVWYAEPDPETGHYRERIVAEKSFAAAAAAVERLRAMPECGGHVCATGYCLGGNYAYLAATRLGVDAAAAFYATRLHDHLDEAERVGCPLLLHICKSDHTHSQEDRDRAIAVFADRPGVTIHLYDSPHGFCDMDRQQTYSARDAELAHARTFALFGEKTASALI